ncbi:RNA polymerase sigma factor SigZ [Dictyobacter formicarum]|uniref:RNA polymerase sigma factor SigZ n=1 Tax=Dictyobacter formicarum TaxID=2778368 RepID=A0ABQ3VDQ9_9CHLR|nr:RNA polymerase sigma factor SigZ [Dictyobacter formicarum]GHO84100.1 hypothetical protein KSZ_21060 [Dictyobacter formicarum]
MLPEHITTEEVWEAFHHPLLRFIEKRVGDTTSAEDILQEVFLKIHQQIGSLKDIKKLESWIYQITRNAIIDAYRRHKNTMPLDTPEVLELPDALPDDDIVSELFPSIRGMVTSLPAQDRQALILTEYQGLTQKELSERLGISLSGAKSRVQRAREKLKQMLLECCHFELDRRGHVINYQSRCQCCTVDTCCSQTPPLIQVGKEKARPFPTRASTKVKAKGTASTPVPAKQ